eukprot:5853924-Prymnesium_polylepis.1
MRVCTGEQGQLCDGYKNTTRAKSARKQSHHPNPNQAAGRLRHMDRGEALTPAARHLAPNQAAVAPKAHGAHATQILSRPQWRLRHMGARHPNPNQAAGRLRHAGARHPNPNQAAVTPATCHLDPNQAAVAPTAHGRTPP